MARRLLISSQPGERRCAWLSGDRLEDLAIQRADRPSHLGSLYLGRIAKRDKDLDAAFVDLGLDRPALLPAGACPGGLPPEGEARILRVVREPAAGKGARVTARIEGPSEDLAALSRGKKAPALLRAGDGPVSRLLAESEAPAEILVNDPGDFAALRADLAERRPELLPVLRLVADGDPFEAAGLEETLDGLLAPRVGLPGGGHLLIEPVATLTAIDVNSGGRAVGGGPARLAEAVNRAAVPEIARQLRLRALSGLIAIDFLEEPSAGRTALRAVLRQALKPDPEPCRVVAVTPSGLAEVTRRRGRPPLHELLTEPAGAGGGGRRKDPVTVAFEALRALRRARTGARPGLAVAPALAAALRGPAAPALKALETRLGIAITLRTEAAWPSDRFEPLDL